jgi:hypothetical protein
MVGSKSVGLHAAHELVAHRLAVGLTAAPVGKVLVEHLELLEGADLVGGRW